MRLPVTGVAMPFLLLIVLAAAVFLSGCNGDRAQDARRSKERQASQAVQTQEVPVEGGGNYNNISAEGVAKMLRAKDFPLVNVHVPRAGRRAPLRRSAR